MQAICMAIYIEKCVHNRALVCHTKEAWQLANGNQQKHGANVRPLEN